MAKDIRKKLEKWQRDKNAAFYAVGGGSSTPYIPAEREIDLLSEKIDFFAELLDDKLESLKEELKR